MTSIDIPPSVKKIKNDALWRCKKLKTVRIDTPRLLKEAGLDENVKIITKERLIKSKQLGCKVYLEDFIPIF